MRQIKASAGSGKTYRLTHAFLEHLCGTACCPPLPSCTLSGRTGWGDILGITFTNSAAAEMKSRVMTCLKEMALGKTQPDGFSLAPPQAAAWVDMLLRHYNALNIRTIDSLLYHIVRTAALELGLPPDFNPVFSDQEVLISLFDACRLDADAGDSQLLHLLREACASLLEDQQLQRFLPGQRLLQQLEQIFPLILQETQQQSILPTASRQELARRYGIHKQMLEARARQLLTLCAKEQLPLLQRAKEALEKCLTFPARACTSTYLQKPHLDGCLKKAGQGTASPEAAAAYQELCAAAATLGSSGEVLRQGMQYAAIVDLARKLAQRLEEYQQREARIPSLLIPLLARQVLERDAVPAALCRLGSRLTHLLIDEFQDTSREQWNALLPLIQESLAQGGSLTWVGDMKQAIYGWRGGDASLFDEIATLPALCRIAPETTCLSLQDNWRSCPEIVSFNNSIFQQLENPATALDILCALLPQDASPQLLGEAAAALAHNFKESAQTIPPNARHTEGGFVRITRIEEKTADELYAIINTKTLEQVREIGRRRPWSDIVILVRSNPQSTRIAAYLTEHAIPVVTENSLLLKEHPLILQLAAFLAFLDNPEDDIAFWTLVTGSIFQPLTGMDRTDLYAWAANRCPGSLSSAFQQAFPRIWRNLFAPFHRQGNLMRPYDSVQECCRLQQLFQRFPEAETFIRRFLEVLHAAEERGCTTPSLFLEHWNQRGDEEKLPMPEHMDAVRIMTIHKAKGLQFPVVIVPQMDFSIKVPSTPVRVPLGGLECIVPCCKAMGDRYTRALADTACETLNLLYVAWTRAEEELYLFHTSTQRSQAVATALDLLFAGAGCQPDCTRGTPPVAPVPQAVQTPLTTSAPALPPVVPAPQDDSDSPTRLMPWLPRLKVFRTPSDSYLSTGRRRGILAHLCLEQLRPGNNPQKAAQRAVTLGLNAFPLPLPDKEQLEQELTTALAWYAALPDAAFWLEHGIPEQRILDAEGREHRVDLLVCPQDAQQGYTVVEYKTGAPEPAHIVQVRGYLRLLGAAQDTPAQAVLIYLDRQRCQRVSLESVSALLPSPPAFLQRHA